MKREKKTRAVKVFPAKGAGRAFLCGILTLLTLAVLPAFSAESKDNIITVPAYPALHFSMENVITRPPGEVSGRILQSDGLTPSVEMKVALVHPDSGEVVAGVLTDEEGRFVFEDVALGRYVFRVGNPGILTILDIEEGVEPEEVDLIIPRAATLPMPGWAPQWAQNHPGLAYTAVGAGAAIIGAAYYRYNIRRTDRDRVISPIMP